MATSAETTPWQASGRLQAAPFPEFGACALAMAGGYALLMNLEPWLPLPGPAELVPALGLGLGAMLASLRQWKLAWTLPLVAAGGALLESSLGGHSLLLVGAALGVATTWVRQRRQVDWIDLANGALAGLAGAAVSGAVWAASAFGAVGTSVFAGLAAALLLLPTLLRWKPRAHVPGAQELKIRLAEPHRPPVQRASELYAQLRAEAPDTDTLDGLAEVAAWVYNLAQSLQTIGQQLKSIDRVDLVDRIELLTLEIEETRDDFTRDRRLATARHLEQMLRHADQLDLEQERLSSLQDYALAYLEEARVGLTLARTLPGEQTPSRLGEVLGRLRQGAVDGDARRQSAREVHALA